MMKNNQWPVRVVVQLAASRRFGFGNDAGLHFASLHNQQRVLREKERESKALLLPAFSSYLVVCQIVSEYSVDQTIVKYPSKHRVKDRENQDLEEMHTSRTHDWGR